MKEPSYACLDQGIDMFFGFRMQKKLQRMRGGIFPPHGGWNKNQYRGSGDEIALSDADGLTISGGEPFLQAEELGSLVTQIREIRPMGSNCVYRISNGRTASRR